MRTLGLCGLAAFLWMAAAPAQAPDAATPVRVRQLIAEFKFADASAAARELVADLDRRGQSGTLEYAGALDLLAEAQLKAGAPPVETSKLLNQAVDLKTLSRPEKSTSGALLAVGDADFAQAAAPSAATRAVPEGCVGFSSMRFDPLPASGVEAHSILEM